MGGTVPPLPQYAFMAWCSVRGSTGTTFSTEVSMKLRRDFSHKTMKHAVIYEGIKEQN
jgi:hypothetical protein